MDIWLKVFIAFVVIQNVQTQSRPVVNTTCLELAKPSNQQYRLICSHHDYHCLLDESYTQEFEVCREWKWIPGGKCAYFNTYGSGNVDERQCEPGINLTCSESNRQFESKTNIQFTACYAKRDSSTSLSTSTSPVLVTSNNVTSNGDLAKSSLTSKAWIFFLFTGIAVFLSITAILFIRGYMDKPLCKIESSEGTGEQQSFLGNKEKDIGCPENQQTLRHEDEKKSRTRKESSEGTGEQQSFLGNKEKDIGCPENQQTLRHEDEKKSRTRKGKTPGGQIEDKNKSWESTSSSCSTPVILDSDKENEEELPFHDANSFFHTKDTDEGKKEKSAKTASGSGFDSVTSDNEEDKDKKESTGVFDDTFESLRRKAPQTDAEGHEELYNLLNGGTLTPKVMAAVIKKMTGKTVKELLYDKNVKMEVRNLLRDETIHIVHAEKGEDSIHVSYALLRMFLDKEHHPISGWGNPVKDKDIDIGDDIDRLFRIFTITEKISNPNMLSVESYNRLLDIMVKAFTRLDLHVDAQFKEDIKAFILKCRSTSLTEKVKNFIEYILQLRQ